MRFRTTIELRGKTATGFEVPAGVVAALGDGKKPRVTVRIGPHTYRSTVAVYAGRFMLPLNAENRGAAQVRAGDTVEVTLELDTAVREVELPDDVRARLRTDPTAQRRFDESSYTRRREFVAAIQNAKRPETRERRIASMLTALHATD